MDFIPLEEERPHSLVISEFLMVGIALIVVQQESLTLCVQILYYNYSLCSKQSAFVGYFK